MYLYINLMTDCLQCVVNMSLLSTKAWYIRKDFFTEYYVFAYASAMSVHGKIVS